MKGFKAIRCLVHKENAMLKALPPHSPTTPIAQHGLRVTARPIALLWWGDRGQEITNGSFAGEDAYGDLNKNGP